MKCPGAASSVCFSMLYIQVAKRIHEERRAAAHFVAQQSDAGARLVERFDDDVLELVAKELLDRAFVFFLDFGVVGEQADGAESALGSIGLAFGIGVEKFLHGVGRVGALAQNFLDGSVACAFGRKAFPGALEFLTGFLLRAAKLDQPCCASNEPPPRALAFSLELLKEDISRVHALGENRAFSLDRAQRRKALLLGGRMPRGRFLGLQRFGLCARGFFDQATGQLAKLFHARFELFLLGDTRRSLLGRFAQSSFERRALLAKLGE